MKLFELFLETEEFGGLNTSWEHDGIKITLSDLLSVTKNIPITNVNPKTLEKYALNWKDKSEIDKIQKSDLNFPILILTDKNKILSIIDGNHRLRKSLINKLETIKAKFIDINQLPENFQKVFS